MLLPVLGVLQHEFGHSMCNWNITAPQQNAGAFHESFGDSLASIGFLLADFGKPHLGSV